MNKIIFLLFALIYLNTSAQISKPVNIVVPVDTTVGLVSYKYYTGNFDNMPDFNKLIIKRSGLVKNFNVNTKLVVDTFALQFDAYINIDSTGTYKFGISSDDGSRLFIDSTLIVDNNGLHGSLYKEGTLKLTKGSHKILIQYFEKTGEQNLNVYWQPYWKLEKELIPVSVLSNKPIVITPPIIKPKVIGSFKLFQYEIILFDDLTWQYSEIIDLKSIQ